MVTALGTLQPQQFVDDFSAHFGIATRAGRADIAALKFRPNKVGKWKVLPPRQLAWCEGILQEELREFGYPLASAAPELPGHAQLLVANARDRIRRVPQKVRRVVARVRS